MRDAARSCVRKEPSEDVELTIKVLGPHNFVRLVLLGIGANCDDGVIEHLLVSQSADDELLGRTTIVGEEENIHGAAADIAAVTEANAGGFQRLPEEVFDLVPLRKIRWSAEAGDRKLNNDLQVTHGTHSKRERSNCSTRLARSEILVPYGD